MIFPTDHRHQRIVYLAMTGIMRGTAVMMTVMPLYIFIRIVCDMTDGCYHIIPVIMRYSRVNQYC